jgi:IMP dehydrogenase
MKMRKTVTYDDVLLVPQYSDIRSRKEVNIGSFLDKKRFYNLPIISSPMDTVTESSMATAMSLNGGFGVVHRYNTIQQQVDEILKLQDGIVKAAAVGISGDFAERADALAEAGVDILCLDVAHGHHIMMKEALHLLRRDYPHVHLMAGNVATLQGFEDLASWGADSVRCNIGGGSICSTRVQTGHGIPGLQTIMDCATSIYAGDTKIIADGGIRNSGDIVKALAAGADFVMLGSLLSGTNETPGEVKTINGNQFKEYRGMASKAAQHSWRNKTSSIEGVVSTVPCKGSARSVLEELAVGIRSGLSYTGARTIYELQDKCEFVMQTNASQIESSPHILRN